MPFKIAEPESKITTRLKLKEETHQLRDELVAFAKQDSRLKNYDIDAESDIVLNRLYKSDLKNMKAAIAKLDTPQHHESTFDSIQT